MNFFFVLNYQLTLSKRNKFVGYFSQFMPDYVQSEFGHVWATIVLNASRYSTEDSTDGDTLRF